VAFVVVKMKAVNLIQLYELCKDKDKLLVQLRKWKLVPEVVKCPRCRSDMELYADSNRCEIVFFRCWFKLKVCSGKYSFRYCRADGWRWFCRNKAWRQYAKSKPKPCGQTQEFRKGTFFEKSKLSIFQILAFSHCWVQKMSLNVISRELEIVGDHTTTDWASFCREVVFAHMLDKPEKIGGVGKIVEIDESKFGKRKYHRGHRVEGQWVFGGYERGTGRVFMVPVEFRYVRFLVVTCEIDVVLRDPVFGDNFWKMVCVVWECGVWRPSENLVRVG
jgi:hypothetical protein